MKITDYGFWFYHFKSHIWLKQPLDSEPYNLYLCGQLVGGMNEMPCFVDMGWLADSGFQLSSTAPGHFVFEKYSWRFPLNYIPRESDFKDI